MTGLWPRVGQITTELAQLRSLPLVGLMIALLSQVGCDAPIDAFEPNRLFAKRLELTEQTDLDEATGDIQSILVELFGTPDQPNWPEFLATRPELTHLVSSDNLQRAAGAVRSDQSDKHFGLYREHCILCHGIAGNGLGATSRMLNPYPRDFRAGKFKFKSTPIGSRPTRDDLKRVLAEGIPGTSMPSFRLLVEEDLTALVDYVIYLSIRGEVERSLLARAAYELDIDADERLVDFASREADPAAYQAQWREIEQNVLKIAENWATASQKQLSPVAPPPDLPLFGQTLESEQQAQVLADSVAHGRALFQGKVANCSSCHGPSAAGDGLVNDFDDWTKEWTTNAGLDPLDKQQLQPMLELGALKPRHIVPRNLQTGVYRGGSRPADLYRRIVLGIEGTPMPAAPMQPDFEQGLSDRDVWDLVNFLLSLPASSPQVSPQQEAQL